jgi:hypothetical protein
MATLYRPAFRAQAIFDIVTEWTFLKIANKFRINTVNVCLLVQVFYQKVSAYGNNSQCVKGLNDVTW